MAAVELTPTREAAGMDRSLAPPSKGKTMTNGPDIDGVLQYGKQLGEDIEDGDGGDLLANPSVFQVIGTNCQILNIQLQPKQKVSRIRERFIGQLLTIAHKTKPS